MRVLVAGASGFVGRHVVAQLVSAGHELIALDRGRRPVPPGARHVICDLMLAEPPVEALAGVEAVVNLVGIKRAAGAQTFERAHVHATRHLLDAARRAGVQRFVHVSVAGCRPGPVNPYDDTKWRAEELVRASGLAATILKPGVIFGRGDDMIAHLVKMIRFMPLFPIVGRGRSLLQPVDVDDVALAIARTLARPQTAGRTYDLVGPERLILRSVVARVARAMALPLTILPTPLFVMRPLVAAMSALSSRALSTPSQLRILERGMIGDTEPARRDLGIEPRPFAEAAISTAAAGIAPLFGFTMRKATTDDHARWLAAHARFSGRAAAVALAGILLMPAAGLVIGNVWYRMAFCGAVLVTLALRFVPLGWRELYRPVPVHLAWGVLSAAALYGIGAAVFQALQHVAGAPAQIAAAFAWRDAVPFATVLPLLLFIVLAEEIVWRNAVTLPFAGRFGPVAGSALAAVAFAAAHVSLGIPVLLVAALGAGFIWSALVVRTRSAVAAFVSHVLWDLAVLFVFPYGG